ncbi:alpha/beta hydrolase [Panacibacter ginsenosidivorans]|uniref:Alpha/beta hydrolase n=1 Tax=Panacibacter ginsenosidivorans TaxID=1813871 RepID=A0A5B8V548_9BACT|nr:alpha/beta hydrolase-fold protein [Panacibacter ginsenosidivorans]QEC66504.1 alpha/beta hydrolase [Panacibacter ginsenosidivorans]
MNKAIRLTTVLALTVCTTILFGQTNKNAEQKKVKPFILGEIHEIQSAELSEKRILNIYLPEGYDRADTARYPVVYLLDGSADEDFIHITGLYQFNNFPWINRVPKSIVVGIANVDRKRDFTYPTTITEDFKKYPTTGQSEKFINFIEKELQPYIDKTFNTNTSKTIIGQSLGGLLATEILLKKPRLFNKYIIISPSLWWDNGSLLNIQSEILQNTFKEKTDIYIGVGKEGLGPGVTPHVMEVDANLLAEKIKKTQSKSVTVYFDYLPQEDHATITHQAVFNALRLLYPLNK